MATQADVRRIALGLPDVAEREERFGFHVVVGGKPRGLAWVWLERIHPKQARVPNPKVLAVATADLDEKAALLAGDPDVFFTEPHYDGYPAVMVRLDAIDVRRLRAVLARAHEAVVAKATAKRPRATGTTPRRRATGTTPRPRATARRRGR